jgi:hypothetical protein
MVMPLSPVLSADLPLHDRPDRDGHADDAAYDMP